MDFLQPYLGNLITALVAGFGGWFFQRKQKHAELEALRADNSKQVVQLYQDALDDLKVRYEEKFTTTQKDYNAKTANLIKNFEGRHQELEKRFDSLQKDYDSVKRKYTALKKEFEEYKKRHG